MAMKIIDGKALAGALYEQLAEKTAEYSRTHQPPCLAVVSAGDDPASKIYITSKQKALEKAGMQCKHCGFDASVTQEKLIAVIEGLNADKTVHGILVQLPLPHSVDTDAVMQTVSPEKDIDGFTPVNLGKLLAGKPAFVPCTPQGVMYALEESGIPVSGAHVVIVGRSAIVGKPLAALLTNAHATVTLCHTKTKDLGAYTRHADIVISAAGSPNLITADMIQDGAAVIDVGINRIKDSTHPKGSRLAGDVDFESVKEKAGFITPVPGGVGPLTVAMVVRNTLQAALRQSGV